MPPLSVVDTTASRSSSSSSRDGSNSVPAYLETAARKSFPCQVAGCDFVSPSFRGLKFHTAEEHKNEEDDGKNDADEDGEKGKGKETETMEEKDEKNGEMVKKENSGEK